MGVLDDLAAEGFETHTPDLLHRIESGHDPTLLTTRLVPEDTHERDLLDVFDHMAATPLLVGLCFGAEMGWRLAVKRRPVAAALIYGVAPEDVSRLGCPVFAAYAEDDDRVNEGFAELCRQLARMDRFVLRRLLPGHAPRLPRSNPTGAVPSGGRRSAVG
jgi:dienelactone hydrolase